MRQPLMIFGIVLVAIGILALGWHAVDYYNPRPTPAGEALAQPNTSQTIGFIVSGVAVVVGLGCMMLGARRRSNGLPGGTNC